MHKLLPLETSVVIHPSSKFKHQGYDKDQALVGAIYGHHKKYLTASEVGSPVDANLFCYYVRWSDGRSFGYRAKDVVPVLVNNESMLHLLHSKEEVSL